MKVSKDGISIDRYIIYGALGAIVFAVFIIATSTCVASAQQHTAIQVSETVYNDKGQIVCEVSFPANSGVTMNCP